MLRLTPEAFWRMTPRELFCALEAVLGVPNAPLQRAALIDLMQRFPDSHSRLETFHVR